MTDQGLERAVLEAAGSLAGEAEAMLARLVRHRSVLGEEAGCLGEMEAIYAEAGLRPTLVPTDPATLGGLPGWSPPLIDYVGRDNVVALHRPTEANGRSLMLQGHVDVVPEGAADLWTTPPFDPQVRGGRLYGRGAGDMKAGLVSTVMALKALRLAGLAPAALVQFAAVVEEECTGNGALAVMHALPRPDACLIPEPGPGHPALYVAEVGVVWAWITVTGRPAHVREAQAGVSAIEAAALLLPRLREYESEANRAERRHPAFARENHPINVNVGTLHGGEWNSSVPTRARLGVRVGVMPGRSCREVARDIEALVAAAAADPQMRGARLGVEWGGFMADGCTFPPAQEIAQAVAAAHRDVTGAPVRHYAAPGLTDARHYVLHGGVQATCYGPDAENIHGIDESVGLAAMHDVTRVIALTLVRWCGTERAG